MITKADLLEDFEYNPITGLFVRKTSKGKWKSGEIAGGIDVHGYVKIRVKNSKYAAHRLAFLYMTGEVPNMIDHINRIKSDNRWENLRACDASENAANRSVHSNNSLGRLFNLFQNNLSNIFNSVCLCNSDIKSKT